MPVIFLNGPKSAGKDQTYDVLKTHFGFEPLRFSDAIYLEVAKTFGVTVKEMKARETKEQPSERLALSRCKSPEFLQWKQSIHESLQRKPGKSKAALNIDASRSPRVALQEWGDFRREQNLHYFINATVARATQALQEIPPITRFCVPDGRYPAESSALHGIGLACGGHFNVLVVRPFANLDMNNANHATERMWRDQPASYWDAIVINDGPIDALPGEVLRALASTGLSISDSLDDKTRRHLMEVSEAQWSGEILLLPAGSRLFPGDRILKLDEKGSIQTAHMQPLPQVGETPRTDGPTYVLRGAQSGVSVLDFSQRTLSVKEEALLRANDFSTQEIRLIGLAGSIEAACNLIDEDCPQFMQPVVDRLLETMGRASDQKCREIVTPSSGNTSPLRALI